MFGLYTNKKKYQSARIKPKYFYIGSVTSDNTMQDLLGV